MFLTSIFKKKTNVETIIEKYNEMISFTKQQSIANITNSTKIIITNKELYLSNLNFIVLKFNQILKEHKSSKADEDKALSLYVHSNYFNTIFRHFDNNVDILLIPFLSLSIFTLKLYNYNSLFLKSQWHLFQDILQCILPFTSDSEPFPIISELLNEMTKLFSKENNLYVNYSIKPIENSLYITTQGTLVFSCLLNMIKNDHLHKNTDIKNNIRRGILSCIQYNCILESEFFKLCYFPEIIIDRLCTYFELMPNSFEVKKNSVTLDIAYNIKETFPILLSEFLEFRDFISFFNRLFETIRSNKLVEEIKIQFFNWFLIDYIQPRLLSNDLNEVRTNLQYIIFLMKNIKCTSLASLIYFFIFGFPDSLTNFNLKKSGREGYLQIKKLSTYNKIKLKKKNSSILSNSDGNSFETKSLAIKYMVDNKASIYENPILNNNERISNVTSESVVISNDEDPFSFNYKNHDYIGISNSIISKLSLKKKYLNIVCLAFFDVMLERFPFLSVQRFILPFCESIVEKHRIQVSKLSTINTGDVSHFMNFIELCEERRMSVDVLIEYLNYNLSRSAEIYLRNDIDFFLYYQSIREDKEQLNFIDRQIRDSMDNDQCDDIRVSTYNKGEVLSNYLMCHNKAEYKIKKSNQYISKIYDDEAEGIEDEMKNVFIGVFKHIIEEFTSFFYNTPLENLFLTGLITRLILIPKLEFDPATTLLSNLILDDMNISTISIYQILSLHVKEATNLIKEEPIILEYINSTKLKEINEVFGDAKYIKLKNKVENIIILKEFIKEFLSSILHKPNLEHRIEQLFMMYSEGLDDYYYKDNLSVIEEF